MNSEEQTKRSAADSYDAVRVEAFALVAVRGLLGSAAGSLLPLFPSLQSRPRSTCMCVATAVVAHDLSVLIAYSCADSCAH